MTSHQTHPSLSSLPGHILIKRSNSNFESSKPWRTVGGIDEAPLHPKHTQHPNTTTTPPTTLNNATHLFNSRLFTKAHLPTTTQPTTAPRIPPTARNPSISFTRTHKSNFSDSTAVSYQNLNKQPTMMPTYHHHPSIPSTYDQTPIHLHKQLPPHSVVASLGLAPISNSIPSRHPFNLRPLRISKDPSPNHTTAPSDPFLSFPKLPSIPSLLNPERAAPPIIDQPHTRRDDDPHSDYTKLTYSSYDVHDSPGASLEITASDQPLMSRNPFPIARSLTYTTDVRPTHPIPPRSEESLPRCESPVIGGMSDTPIQIEPSAPPPQTNLPAKQSYPPDEPPCTFFETAAKGFTKYTTLKPRLNANTPAYRPNLIVHSIQHRDDQKTKTPVIYPSIAISKNLREISSDSSLEELKDRYWNSKDQNQDANQVWAEIYISQLERKLWKAEAESDISLDCFKFCTPLGSNNKSKKAHRRTSSAPNLKHAIKPTVDRRGNNTHQDSNSNPSARSKFDHAHLRKPSIGKTFSNLLAGCPSTGSINGFPCINPRLSDTDSSLSKANFPPPPRSATCHRASSAPRPISNPRGTRCEAASHGPKIITPEAGYRIVIPNAHNPILRNPKTLWRRSRSVPNLRENRIGGFDSSHDLDGTADPFLYSRDRPQSRIDANSSANPKVPQSLLDAIFLTSLESKEKSAPSPPGELPCVQSPTRNMILQSENAMSEGHHDNYHPDVPTAIGQATDAGPKGPLHSLPRFVEPRSNVIMALPPPPRKRTATPVTSTDSPGGTSAPGNKRSTTQSTPSHSSWGARSQKTHSKSSLPSPSKINRRVSPALTIRNNLPKVTDDPSPNIPALPRLSATIPELRYPSRPRSLSFVHQTSPSIDSGKRFSGGFISEASSRRCSLDMQSALMDEQYGLCNLPVPSYNEPPLSAFRFAKLTPRLDSTRIPTQVDHSSAQDAQDDQRVVDTQRQSYTDVVALNQCSLSSPIGSSHSVIDPDVYIDQANLFYQMPATPQRDLIEDYDNRIFKPMQTTTNNNLSGPSTTHPKPTYGKPARLIDQILAGYMNNNTSSGTGNRGMSTTSVLNNETDLMRLSYDSNPSPIVLQHHEENPSSDSKPDEQRHSLVASSSEVRRRSSAIHRAPDIVDAFEARLSGILLNNNDHTSNILTHHEDKN